MRFAGAVVFAVMAVLMTVSVGGTVGTSTAAAAVTATPPPSATALPEATAASPEAAAPSVRSKNARGQLAEPLSGEAIQCHEEPMRYPSYTYHGELLTLTFEASTSCTGPIQQSGQAVLETASGTAVASGNSYNEATTFASSSGTGTNLKAGNYKVVYTRSNYSPNGWTNKNPYCTVNGDYLNCTRAFALTLRLPVPGPKESRGSGNPGSRIRQDW